MLDVAVKTMQRRDQEDDASEIATRQLAYCRISSAAQRLDSQNQRRGKDRLTRLGFGWFGHDAL